MSHQTAFVLVAKSKCGLPPANAVGAEMAERKMKSSDSELQVLMDEAQEKQQGPHLTVSERNHFRDGVSPCESDVVCKCNPPDCEG